MTSSQRPPTASEASPTQMRRVLGSFATGVTIITAHGPSGPVGMAANSFTSVSLDPPLVLFCAGKSSTTWPDIREAGHFCVNVVREDGESLCRQFAAKGVDRFADVSHREVATGAPVLEDALAWVDCEITAEHDAGDHVIVVGRVLALDGDDADTATPLVFFRGGYGQLTS